MLNYRFCSLCTFHLLFKVLLTHPSSSLCTLHSLGTGFRKTKTAKGAFAIIVLFYFQLGLFFFLIQNFEVSVDRSMSPQPSQIPMSPVVFFHPLAEEACFSLRSMKSGRWWISKGISSATMLQRGEEAEILVWHGEWWKWGRLESERKIDAEKLEGEWPEGQWLGERNANKVGFFSDWEKKKMVVGYWQREMY